MSYAFKPCDDVATDGYYVEIPGFHEVALRYLDDDGVAKVYYEVVWATAPMAVAQALATLGRPVSSVIKSVVRPL